MIDAVAENCISYVAGYLLHKADVGCSVCHDALVKGTNIATWASETLAALKSHTSLTCFDVGSLELPTQTFLSFVTQCYVMFSVRARSLVLESNITKSLVGCMLASKQAKVLRTELTERTELCHPALLATMAATYTRLMMHSLCQRLARECARRGQACKSRKLNKLH